VPDPLPPSGVYEGDGIVRLEPALDALGEGACDGRTVCDGEE